MSATGASTQTSHNTDHTAHRLYGDDNHYCLELDNTVYVLNSSTIDPCLSLFPWAGFAKPKRLSNSIPCWICTAISQHSSISPTENCMMCMSWTEPTLNSHACTDSISSAVSLCCDRSPIPCSEGCIPTASSFPRE